MTNPDRATRRITPLIALIWMGVAGLWLLPLAAMQFLEEMRWTPFDFAAWAVMLVAAALPFDLAVRLSRNPFHRAGVLVAVATAFPIVWSNLAVGIVGNEDNPANLMFFAVLAVPLIGGAFAGFRARGMSLALTATALAQVLVAAVFLVSGEIEVLLTGVFVVMWLISAGLFHSATRPSPPAS